MGAVVDSPLSAIVSNAASALRPVLLVAKPPEMPVQLGRQLSEYLLELYIQLILP